MHLIFLRIEQTQEVGAVGAVDTKNGSMLQQRHEFDRRIGEKITEELRSGN